jgi:hypothetical protein
MSKRRLRNVLMAFGLVAGGYLSTQPLHVAQAT